ncbi:DUF4129 domain-containing protein [Isoptericola variabilis]|uniref:Protein-glutamine gamma-glutamyltransferase-like C-terminal domain-containing protein n=1 Tax=Isoptericola variabilis (strain 225) TaxID=743718 RepID=F6FUV4_ISOV2|nr:DUF4129 domain-containing protein [Isoptericola variabilis]AEG44294.1 hypothetical protein Isova_1540 [Isoptericola variabilis 225]TWH28865.1 uncharacterized protein DUF4129 [Isoptericola variabilis J7]
MPRRRTPTPAGLRALAVLGLLVLVVLGAAAATPWRVTPPEALLGEVPGLMPSLPSAPTSVPSEAPRAEPESGGGDLGLALLLAGLLVVAVLLALAGRRILAALRDAEPPPEPDTTEVGVAAADGAAPAVTVEELADAVALALRRLDGARTPHDAVVAAWVSLEEAAARHGTERDPAQTPTEFTVALLHDSPAPAADVATLRRLYHHARFASRPVDADQAAAARDALERIARTLEDHDPLAAPPGGRTP